MPYLAGNVGLHVYQKYDLFVHEVLTRLMLVHFLSEAYGY